MFLSNGAMLYPSSGVGFYFKSFTLTTLANSKTRERKPSKRSSMQCAKSGR